MNKDAAPIAIFIILTAFFGTIYVILKSPFIIIAWITITPWASYLVGAYLNVMPPKKWGKM